MRLQTTIFLSLACFISCVSQPAQKLSKEDLSISRKDAGALVVVHSRSGFTAAAGLEISKALQTDYIRLAVPDGAGDNYLSSPNRNEEVTVTPGNIGLTKYRIVFLGSPIWWGRATAYLFTFIKKNDFTGKRVILFYTYQGGIDRGAVEEWKKLVASRNGQVVDVIAIDRSELKNESVAAMVSKIVAQKKESWLKQ